MRFYKRALFITGFVLAQTTSALTADGLPALASEDRAAWSAIGAVTSTGQDSVIGCSGILVAPDLFITAAHCTVNNANLMDSLQFIAGLDGSRRVASSSSVDVTRYPVWDFATGTDKVKYDIAAVRLGRRIPSDRAKAVSLLPEGLPLPATGALLAYQKSSDKTLKGMFDCPLTVTENTRLIISACPVRSGNSGGAVMVRNKGEWLLAGIIVARADPGGTAIAVGLNEWLRDLIDDAKQRAE